RCGRRSQPGSAGATPDSAGGAADRDHRHRQRGRRPRRPRPDSRPQHQPRRTRASTEGRPVTVLAGVSLGTDIKKYSRGALPRIALVTIILMPLLYGAMYLWAFWNPFDEIDKVPVALVNEDRGAEVQGRRIDAGDEVARALLDSGQLQLHEV